MNLLFLRRVIGSFLCGLLFGLIIYDGEHAQSHDDGTLRRIQAGSPLVIGMDPSYPPFADGRNGAPVGLDVDLAEALGARLGVRIQIQPLGYDGLYDALKVGSVDALISALSVDDSRRGDVNYMGVYFDAGIVIVSRSGAFQRMADLEGHTVAVEYGSAADEMVRRWQRRLHALPATFYPTANDALDAMNTGKSDAALVDSIAAHLYVRSHGGLTISADSVSPDPYAIAVRSGSFILAGALNDALDALRKDGTLDAIIHKWL